MRRAHDREHDRQAIDPSRHRRLRAPDPPRRRRLAGPRQYDYQASLSGGLGYKIVDTERTQFWVQGGPGYRFAEIRAPARKRTA